MTDILMEKLGGLILIVVGLGFLGGTILMLIPGHFAFTRNFAVYKATHPAAHWMWICVCAYAGVTGVMQGVRKIRQSSKN